MKKRLSNKVVFSLLCLVTKTNPINSFTLPCTFGCHGSGKISKKKLNAKAPPTSNFDLDAIEALEAELEWQEKVSEQKNYEHHEKDPDEEDEWNFMDSGHGDNVKTHTVSESLANKRIDSILSKYERELSRSQCGTLISDGMVAMLTPSEEREGQKPKTITRKSEKIPEGTILYLKHVVEETPTEIVAQDLPLDILYEDEHMIVLNKAAGMVVHPAVGNWQGTVVNALAYYLANKSPFGSGDFIEADGKVKSDKGKGIDVDGTDGETITFRPGIVHRLDKGTTGILVVAKTRDALSALSDSFAARKVRKSYVAITVGNPGKRVVIDKPIGRHPIHRQRMRVVPDPGKMNSSGMSPKQRRAAGMGGKSSAQLGRNALSFVDTLAFDGKLSVVQVRIETGKVNVNENSVVCNQLQINNILFLCYYIVGRTHQIRVHLQDRTTPIYGDDVYGYTDWNKRLAKSQGVQRPLLHAFRLELNHPMTGKRMIFRAPMAQDMVTVALGTWPSGPEERVDLFESMEVEIVDD